MNYAEIAEKIKAHKDEIAKEININQIPSLNGAMNLNVFSMWVLMKFVLWL